MDRYEAERLMLALAESTVPEGGHMSGEAIVWVFDASNTHTHRFWLSASAESPEVFCVWEEAGCWKKVCHVSPEVSFAHGI